MALNIQVDASETQFDIRLKKIADRSRLEQSHYPTACEPQIGAAQARRFWTPQELDAVGNPA